MWGRALRGQFSDLADFVAVFGLSRFRSHFRTLPNVPSWSTYFWSRYRRGVFCGNATDMEYKSSEPTHVEYLFPVTLPTWSIWSRGTDLECKSSEPTHVEHLFLVKLPTWRNVKAYWKKKPRSLAKLPTWRMWKFYLVRQTSSKSTHMWTSY